MSIVAGILITLFVIICMFAFPAFGATVILLILGVVGYMWVESDRSERQEKKRLSMISQSDLELSDFRLSNSYGSWEVTGFVKNKSPHPLSSISLVVRLSNCDADEKNCVTVGEDDEVTDYIDIPSGQGRQFKSYVTFSNLPELKKTSWYYFVKQIRAK